MELPRRRGDDHVPPRAPSPDEAVTEPPDDTTDAAAPADAAEQEQVKHDIAGFDKANFNGFFVQSRNQEFRLNI